MSGIFVARTDVWVRATWAKYGALLQYGAPQLAIEIASTTLDDDLGKKRLLYERLSSAEYWVVDAQAAQVIAFQIADRRSGQIAESQVLPGLSMATLEAALGRWSKTGPEGPTQREDDATITRWLLELFGHDAQGS